MNKGFISIAFNPPKNQDIHLLKLKLLQELFFKKEITSFHTNESFEFLQIKWKDNSFFLSEQNLAQKAYDKLEDIWVEVLVTCNESNLFSIPVLLETIFTETMLLTFDTKRDEMPLDFLGLKTRLKLITSVGVIDKVIFKPYGGSSARSIFKGSN